MSMVCQARFPTAVESLDRRGRLLRFVKGALDAHQWEIADTAIRGQTQDEMVTAARWMSRAWGTPPNQIQPPQPKGQTLDEFARTECPNGDQADGNRAARRTAVSATEGWDSELEAAAPDTGSTQAALEEQFPEAFLAWCAKVYPCPPAMAGSPDETGHPAIGRSRPAIQSHRSRAYTRTRNDRRIESRSSRNSASTLVVGSSHANQRVRTSASLLGRARRTLPSCRTFGRRGASPTTCATTSGSGLSPG
jgi:hypothetical protein